MMRSAIGRTNSTSHWPYSADHKVLSRYVKEVKKKGKKKERTKDECSTDTHGKGEQINVGYTTKEGRRNNLRTGKKRGRERDKINK